MEIKKGNNLVDNKKRTFQKRYNWDKEEFETFYYKYFSEVLENANVMAGAEIVISKLMEDFDIIIVTARKDDEMKYAINKLTKIDLSKIKIYNNEHNKIETYLKENVDYVIDDDEDVCIDSAKHKIISLYFKNNASDKVDENEFLKNVNNWGEIYKYIYLKNNDMK